MQQKKRSTIGYTKPKKNEFIMREGWSIPEKPCRKGHLAPRNHFAQCVACIRENRAKHDHFSDSSKKWQKDNKEKTNLLRRRYNRRNADRRMITSAKQFCKNTDIPFDLKPGDIVVPENCPVLGIPLFQGDGKRSWNSPSIDRIIPEKGYVKGNVIVVSWRVNRIKCDATIEELRTISNFYEAFTETDRDFKSLLRK
jgi:hypothetical protein